MTRQTGPLTLHGGNVNSKMFISVLTLLVASFLFVTCAAQAQTFKVIHDFTGGPDGANPYSGLISDAKGNLFGTAYAGGNGFGTAFEFSPTQSGWTFKPIYTFAGGTDGAGPGDLGRLLLGTDGSLYGTTDSGGISACTKRSYVGCGTIFNLKQGVTICRSSSSCPWTETVLYRFTGGSDGAFPEGDLRFDKSGNIYGTAQNYPSPGNAYELVSSGNTWTHKVLYVFNAQNDGCFPTGGVIFDNAGNLYGASSGCGIWGTFWELTPSQPFWTENVLYRFPQDISQGGDIYGGLLLDQAGNFYGTANYGGPGGGGTAYQLTDTNGSWAFSRFYAFTGSSTCGPYATLIMDQTGNLYGTTGCDGTYSAGSVFKLTPSGGTWTYESLHDFTGGTDGGVPTGSVVFDLKGNILGTTQVGGANGKGVVFEIAP